MTYSTSLERERAITQYVFDHGPVDYARWAKDFMFFRNRVIVELERLHVPDDWLVKSSLAASRAWEAENPCPISTEEIERWCAEATKAIGD
jgi:hypothetical protein